jgi:4-hydroxy-3-polyprenylbenzoate decarboxylase
MSVSVDRSRIPRTYRDYLDTLKGMGELVEIDDEVDWDLELGAIFRRTAETLSPGAIFNNVKGCPKGFRAADLGYAKSGRPGQPWARLAVMLGLPPDTDLMSIQRAYLEAKENGESQPPRIVDAANAPCKENKWFGDDIDITRFPAPIGHEGDGGRYIQTGGINIVRTPDRRWTNWSTNRGMIVDRNHMTGLWLAVQHNGMIHKMWADEAKDTPWALALGVSPVVMTQAAAKCPDWVDEYDYASALLGDAIDMVECETNDLLVPADSEIVIEGVVSRSEVETEGPFGEFPGYLPESTHQMPRQTITAVTFRNDPILPISLPGVPTDNCHIGQGFFMSADAVVALRKGGLPVMDAMLTMESALHWFVIRVPRDWYDITGLSVDNFIKLIANTYGTQHIGHIASKILVVGEDIDPADPNLVTWAFATRNHPTLGTYHFPKLCSVGTGLEPYRAVVNPHLKNEGGLVVYSCLAPQTHIGFPDMKIMSFEKNYPKQVQEKVLANWSRWGFDKGA